VTVVVDASVVVAALIDTGADGTWADGVLGSDALVAPHLLPAEVANVLRRAALAGDVSTDSASLAYADLLKLRIDLFGYDAFAERVWALRDTLTANDAWYVSIAEALDAPLATLDGRLARSPDVRCRFITRDRSSQFPGPDQE
jgi:predicted nucleic acid-binding protein